MKLLVCVDGSKVTEKVLEKTAELVSGCRIDSITLIHVFDKVTFPVLDDGSVQYNEEILDSYKQMNEELLKERNHILEESAKKLRKTGVEPELFLKEGHPARTIISVAEEGSYDLIIIGSRGVSGLKKSLLGSISNAVIQETNVSVMVVK